MHSVSLSAFAFHYTALFTYWYLRADVLYRKTYWDQIFRYGNGKVENPLSAAIGQKRSCLSCICPGLEEQPSSSSATIAWTERQRNPVLHNNPFAQGFSISICVLKVEFGSEKVHSLTRSFKFSNCRFSITTRYHLQSVAQALEVTNSLNCRSCWFNLWKTTFAETNDHVPQSARKVFCSFLASGQMSSLLFRYCARHSMPNSTGIVGR